jgi:hypothetical protein
MRVLDNLEHSSTAYQFLALCNVKFDKAIAGDINGMRGIMAMRMAKLRRLGVEPL